MFEAAEVGNEIEKSVYKKQVPELRKALLEAQSELAESGLAVMVLMGGVEGAGKTTTVNLLLEWLDTRGIETHAMGDPTCEELERPPMWRYWRLIPSKGHMAIFLGSWYTDPIVNRVFGKISEAEMNQSLDRDRRFEQMLSQEGVLLVKFWLHLSKKVQRDRLKKTEADPLQKWRVTKRDWKFHKKYDTFRSVSEKAILKTNTPFAPWHIVEAADHYYRNVTVAKILLAAMKDRLAADKGKTASPRRPSRPKPPEVNILRSLDLTRTLSEKKYDKTLPKLQGDLNLLTRKMHDEKRSMILVFEGPDAAGKGGAIRRLTTAMDARNYKVSSIAAPTDEELARPYLWRFWRSLPRLGRTTIFDRSWYGRVLVERIEGFCSKEEWLRAYAEINAFEENLSSFGFIVLKFWITISAEEQLQRFKSRQVTAYKQYKLTEEDWRNRAKWDAYEAAAVEMVEKTSTEHAPWVLVEGNDKNFARIKVLKTVVSQLKRAFK